MGLLKTIIIICFTGFWLNAAGQDSLNVSGRVYDTSKLYVVPNVKVFSTSGTETMTDSMGYYKLMVNPSDSIYFNFNNKNSVKYPVLAMKDNEAFDIAIPVKVNSKYKVLQEVTIFTDTYREDSLINRLEYSSLFDPPQEDNINVSAIVGLFKFRKNKTRKLTQQRLLEQEQEAYIDYKFSPKLITRITGLKGEELKEYRRIYRPSYEFIVLSSEVQYYQYIIDSAKEFERTFRKE